MKRNHSSIVGSLTLPFTSTGPPGIKTRFFRRFLLTATLLATVLLGGTIGFRYLEHDSAFDSFYRTLTTITTVGSQELTPLSNKGRVFNSFLIFFGVSAMFFAVGAITQTVLEIELADVYGKRRRGAMLDALNKHTIVCGFGRVGRNASYQLQSAKAPFVVIDRNPDRVARAAAAGMLASVADATQDESLRQAGIGRATGLIAALPSDAENLFVILSAKALNPDLTVVSRASEEEAGDKLKRAGAATVLTPYTIAGRRLADALLNSRGRRTEETSSPALTLLLAAFTCEAQSGPERAPLPDLPKPR